MLIVDQLPWSTANEDLVELFETTGQVELAEILFEGTRSKGCGVVQFAQVPEAETAIGMYLVNSVPLTLILMCLLLQLNSSSTCMVADHLTSASMTAGTPSLLVLLRVDRPCPCKPK